MQWMLSNFEKCTEKFVHMSLSTSCNQKQIEVELDMQDWLFTTLLNLTQHPLLAAATSTSETLTDGKQNQLLHQ